MGREHPCAEPTCSAMVARRGALHCRKHRVHSPQEIARRAAALRGRPRPQQVRDQIAEALRRPWEERFFAKIRYENACWVWSGGRQGRDIGQGQYGSFSSPAKRGMVLAHRFAYEALVGPVPEGLELDHLCRRPLCVNPDHLEPVTHAENMRRRQAARSFLEVVK